MIMIQNGVSNNDGITNDNVFIMMVITVKVKMMMITITVKIIVITWMMILTIM